MKNVVKSWEKSLAGDSLGWRELRDDVNANPRTVRAVSSALIRISTSFPLVFQTMDRRPWSRAMTDGWTSQKSLGPRAAGTSVIRGICSAFSPASDIFSTFAVSKSLSRHFVAFNSVCRISRAFKQERQVNKCISFNEKEKRSIPLKGIIFKLFGI